jgi:hypothetical protein
MRKINKGGVIAPPKKQQEDDFRHSFKRSIIMDKDAKNINFMS